MTISSKQIKEDQVYTKAEVDALIEYAVEQARQIDEESMKTHNRSNCYQYDTRVHNSRTIRRWITKNARYYSTFYGN